MAQKIINVGTDANYGDGEPLRSAFIKVNENFTEVYAEILEGRDSNVVGSDSTILVDAENNKINLDGTVKGDIIPDTNVAYDIGSATKRFKDLYLSGNTINLGGTAISVESGELKLGGVKIPSQTDLDSSIADVTAGKFSFNITGDDSTVRTVQSGSNISIKGGANITTASDVDGNITITGPDLSSYLTAETSHADVVVDGDFTSSGFMKTDGAGNYSVDSATYLSAITLGQVTGVDINNPQDNQVLSYNASSGDWVNSNVSGFAPVNAPTFTGTVGISDGIQFAGGANLWHGAGFEFQQRFNTGFLQQLGGGTNWDVINDSGGNWTLFNGGVNNPAHKQIVSTSSSTVELYYSNDKKLETTTDGVAITGKITGLTDPTAAQDAATKAYVDANAGGSEPKTYSIANGDWTSGIYMEGDNNRITLTHPTPFSATGNVVGTWYNYLYNLKAGDQITVHFNENKSPGGGPIDVTETLTVTNTSYNGYTFLLIDVTGHSFMDLYNIDSITFEHPDGHVALGQDPFPRLGGDLYTHGYAIRTPQSGMDLVLDPNGPGAVDVSTSKIINVIDPTDPQDAATKAYVDANAGGGGGEFATIGTGNLYSANLTNFANTLTSGTQNFLAGTSAGNSLTSGSDNIAIGNNAGAGLTTASNNILIGTGIMADYIGATGIRNVAIGRQAMYRNRTAQENVAIGDASLLRIRNGTQNVAVGNSALESLDGYGSSTNSRYNTAVGALSGHGFNTGTNSVFVGYRAGYYSHNSDTVTMVGAYTGGGDAFNLGSGTNNTMLGYQASWSVNTVSNEITLGNSSVNALRCNTQTITSLSDARDKKDVEDLSLGLNFVEKLRPVAFTWNMRDGGKVDQPDTGFIAQELQQAQEDEGVVLPGLVYATNPEKLEASYGKLIPSLVKSIQELSSQVKELQQQIKDIKDD